MDNYELRKQLSQIYNGLKLDYDDWKNNVWSDMAKMSCTFRGKFINEDRIDFLTRSRSIIDSTINECANVLSAGLQSGLTNPTTRWFKLKLSDTDLMSAKTVQEWLYAVENIIYTIFNRSNFYKITPTAYKELGVFGQPCIEHNEDVETISWFHLYTIGEYMLGMDDKGRTNSCIRHFSMTLSQLVEKFGLQSLPQTLRTAWDNKNSVNRRINVIRTIVPNFMMDKTKLDNKNKPFLSVYYLPDYDDREVLKVSGFDSFPIHAPRWETVGNEAYGISAAMNALGAAESLQKLHIDRHFAVDNMANPPKNVPMSMYNSGKMPNLLPGGINLYDDKLGAKAVTSALQMNFDLSGTKEMIAEFQEVTRQAMHSDLFKMIAMSDKTMTAEEVIERKQEKVILVGPVITNVTTEFLSPCIIRAFHNAEKLGALPPAPQELAGQPIEIEYISLLAQSQKMVELNSATQFTSFVGKIASFSPSAVNKVNVNNLVDFAAETIGVKPSIVRSNEEVEAMMQAQAEQEQQQQQMAMAQQALESAKTLSEIDTSKLGGF